MTYLVRDENLPPATTANCQAYWRDVDALRVVQTLLARDLVRARRLVAEGGSEQDVDEHETMLTFISAKLMRCNIQFYEAVDSLEHAPPQVSAHTHGHSH